MNTEHLSRQIIAEAYGEDFPFDPFHDQFLQYFLDLAEAGQLPRKPGLAECMQGLKARGMKIALATSTQRPVVECYLRNPPELKDVFDATVCGIEVPKGKPEPDIYLEAARRLGLKPEECIGVEDSQAGLQSLTAAGCTRVMIPDLLPFTGVTFPFVSNGGSAMISAWGMMAFVKAADTRQDASFAIRRPKKLREVTE